MANFKASDLQTKAFHLILRPATAIHFDSHLMTLKRYSAAAAEEASSTDAFAKKLALATSTQPHFFVKQMSIKRSNKVRPFSEARTVQSFLTCAI